VSARAVATAALAAATVAACGACASRASAPLVALPAALTFGKTATLTGKIQHVVIIVQENRSFDNLFNGYPGANTVQSGKIHTGATVPLTPLGLGNDTATSHMSTDFLTDYDGGRMDGFDLDPASPHPNLLAYSFVEPTQTKPYYALAQQFVLSDAFFASHIDASFVGHQYIIAAQANHAVNLPTSSWGCASQVDFVPTLDPDRTIGPYTVPCFTYKTIADELDAKSLTWRFYAPFIGKSGGPWSAFQAVSQIYHGPDWKADVISPERRILTDIPAGTLANVTWVVPDFLNSDHPGSLSNSGPDWVASVVNAIGESPFWKSTAIFVYWDEWGGEYDHVPPPYKDYDGDGFRVPLLCISPYAYSGRVNHVPNEVGGILKFVEQTFGLQPLAAADRRAKPADLGCTNPQQTTPRPFTPVAARFGPDYFMHVQRSSDTPPDDQ
jgi:phospholipase C